YTSMMQLRLMFNTLINVVGNISDCNISRHGNKIIIVLKRNYEIELTKAIAERSGYNVPGATAAQEIQFINSNVANILQKANNSNSPVFPASALKRLVIWRCTTITRPSSRDQYQK